MVGTRVEGWAGAGAGAGAADGGAHVGRRECDGRNTRRAQLRRRRRARQWLWTRHWARRWRFTRSAARGRRAHVSQLCGRGAWMPRARRAFVCLARPQAPRAGAHRRARRRHTAHAAWLSSRRSRPPSARSVPRTRAGRVVFPSAPSASPCAASRHCCVSPPLRPCQGALLRCPPFWPPFRPPFPPPTACSSS